MSTPVVGLPLPQELSILSCAISDVLNVSSLPALCKCTLEGDPAYGATCRIKSLDLRDLPALVVSGARQRPLHCFLATSRLAAHCGIVLGRLLCSVLYSLCDYACYYYFWILLIAILLIAILLIATHGL